MSGHRIVQKKGVDTLYSASKFALTAINEGVRQELREMKSNVKITVSSSCTYTGTDTLYYLTCMVE